MSTPELSSIRPAPVEAGPADPRALCERIFAVVADGDLADFEAVIHPDAVNREARTEPPAARGLGPAAFYATALWLRAAFADMRWDIQQVAADGDIVVVHAVATGRHTGPFVLYDEQGSVEQVMPPTGRANSVTHTHWFRVADGQVIEHWANRDDMGMARQLGWIPPGPGYLVRMALAKRRARRAAA